MREIVLLNDVKFDGVINMPLFEIEYISADIELNQYEALIFTSKNAIKAIDALNPEWKKIPSYCIAPKTAQVVKSFNGEVSFIGRKSHGNEFAIELTPLLKGKKVLYIRAMKTVSNLAHILKSQGIHIDELNAYKTVCSSKEFEKPNKNAVIVFTSPSSVECFFKRFNWDRSYKAVVIGKTTAKYMPKEVSFEISKTQSLESCVKLASTL